MPLNTDFSSPIPAGEFHGISSNPRKWLLCPGHPIPPWTLSLHLSLAPSAGSTSLVYGEFGTSFSWYKIPFFSTSREQSARAGMFGHELEVRCTLLGKGCSKIWGFCKERSWHFPEPQGKLWHRRTGSRLNTNPG